MGKHISKYKNQWFVIISALVSAYAYTELILPLIFISWIPFYYVSVKERSYRRCLVNSVLFGGVYGISLFSWVYKTIGDYSESVYLGILVTFGLALVYCTMYSLIALGVCWIGKRVSKVEFQLISVAAFFTLMDWGFSYVYQGIPFLNLRTGYLLGKNLYLIQLAQFGGVPYLTFSIALVNVSIAFYALTKLKKTIAVGLLFLIFNFGAGYFLYNSSQKFEGDSSAFKTSVISGNVNPLIQWNAKTGNTLATNYFKTLKRAVKNKPNIILWPENLFPWNYTDDDDLVAEIVKISQASNAINIFGAKTNVDEGISNTALLVDSNNTVINKYYKTILLEGFEKKFLNEFQIPFSFSSLSQFKVLSNPKTIPTPYGNAGILICNESTEIPYVREYVNNGAQFFFNLSNDGWFKDTFITDYHFYVCRIMAVALRRDFAISSNMGYSGFVSKNGTVKYRKSTRPLTLTSLVKPSDAATFYQNYPRCFIIVLFLSLGLIFIPKLKDKKL